jgi:hypothetical protein
MAMKQLWHRSAVKLQRNWKQVIYSSHNSISIAKIIKQQLGFRGFGKRKNQVNLKQNN